MCSAHLAGAVPEWGLPGVGRPAGGAHMMPGCGNALCIMNKNFNGDTDSCTSPAHKAIRFSTFGTAEHTHQMDEKGEVMFALDISSTSVVKSAEHLKTLVLLVKHKIMG